MIQLRADSRSKRFQVARTFGSIIEFPLEFSIKETLPNYTQPIGDERCVPITICDVASDKDELQYDFEDLASRLVFSPGGTVPQTALKETIKNGLLPKGQTQRINTFSSFYEAHTGGLDAFDSVRSALVVCEYPISIWSWWYSNWAGQFNVLPIGQNPVSGHMYDCDGYKIVNGEPMLIIEAWLGYKVYMSREVFNKAISTWGSGTAVLSTLQLDIDRKKTILEALIDAYKNLIILLYQKILLLKNK